MYEKLKELLLPLLKLEVTQPHPLPGHDQGGGVQVVRADPRYLAYKLFFWRLYAVVWFVGVLVALGILVFMSPWFLLLAIPLFCLAAFKAAVLYVATRMDYELRWYMLTDRSMLIRQGALVVKEMCLTYSNVQNVRITQGPLQRAFGFWNIEVDTAGGGGKSKEEQGQDTHKAVLKGLTHPYEVRDAILEHLHRYRGAGLGDRGDEHQVPAGTAPDRLALLSEIRTEAAALHRTLATDLT